MTSPELIQSAATVVHQLHEARAILSDPNFLHTLQDLGHPYGLLLGQENGSSLTEFSYNSLGISFPQEKATRKALSREGRGAIWPLSYLSIPSSAASELFVATIDPGLKPFWATTILSSFMTKDLSFTNKKNTHNINEKYFKRFSIGLLAISSSFWLDDELDPIMSMPNFSAGMGITSSIKGLSVSVAKNNETVAHKFRWDNLFTQQAFLAPIFLKALAGEKESSERTKELEIGKGSVGLGTTCIKLTTYQGKESFIVKTPQGEPIAQINPGDHLGHLHVSHQAGLMRNLSPLEKAEQITQDFMALFKAVETGGVNLDSKQQEILIKAQNATLIGISHLVRLFRRKTGLPTWKLDVLPELVQKFHQHDSQAVSTAFGGTRKVKPSDVEMMVITPQMRQQLIASI